MPMKGLPFTPGKMEWNHFTKNETLWFDTWVVIYENQTANHEFVVQPRRIGVVVFGAVLAVWIMLFNLVLSFSLCKKRFGERIRPANWLILNFVIAELLTGILIVPLNIMTEREGKWSLGPILCRAWLLAQLFLGSLVMWSLFMVTVDRIIYVNNPHAYTRRMKKKKLAGMILAAWGLAGATIIPTALSIHNNPDTILDEVCAISMSREYAFGASFAAFFLPSTFMLLGTAALVCVACRARARNAQFFGLHDSQTLYHHKCCPDEAYITYIDHKAIGNAASSTAAVNMATIALWAPFYVVSVMVPFCHGLCVNPALWSLCIWVGYASAGLAPGLWFLDQEIRDQYRELLLCRKEELLYEEEDTKKWHFDDDAMYKAYNNGYSSNSNSYRSNCSSHRSHNK